MFSCSFEFKFAENINKSPFEYTLLGFNSSQKTLLLLHLKSLKHFLLSVDEKQKQSNKSTKLNWNFFKSINWPICKQTAEETLNRSTVLRN